MFTLIPYNNATAFMQRSLLRYTHALLLPLLAVGLVLTGCDSSGSSNGEDAEDIPLTVETAHNLLTADLKDQTDELGTSEGSAVTESELKMRYSGDTSGEPILITSRVGNPAQTEYSGASLDNNLSGANLIGSDALEKGVDAPDASSSDGEFRSDELIDFYLGVIADSSSGDELGSLDVYTTDNEVNMGQLVNKLLLGALAYNRGTSELAGIDGTSSDDLDRVETAAEYFGAPDAFGEFLDYASGNEGLSTTAKDVNGDNQVDFNSEYVHTWAAYAAERSAAAENNGNPNDFARRFADSLDVLQTAIENDNSSVDVEAKASDAIEAWEEVVAVNVIHYLNAMKSDLDETSLASGDNVTVGALESAGVRGEFNEHWGEAKPFAWALQHNPDSRISDADLESEIHSELALGGSPPYSSNRSSTVTKQEVLDSIERVKSTLESTYGFNASNVDAW